MIGQGLGCCWRHVAGGIMAEMMPLVDIIV